MIGGGWEATNVWKTMVLFKSLSQYNEQCTSSLYNKGNYSGKNVAVNAFIIKGLCKEYW